MTGEKSTTVRHLPAPGANMDYFNPPEVRAEIRTQKRRALLKAIHGTEIEMIGYAMGRWTSSIMPDLIMSGCVFYTEAEMIARVNVVWKRLKRLRELVESSK